MKNSSFPKCPKITQKFTQNRKTLVDVLNGRIWRCLKHERDIGRNAMLIDVKTSLQVYSRLKSFSNNHNLTPPVQGTHPRINANEGEISRIPRDKK